jgi:NADH-quinone oxidoreductase subunit D
MTVAAGAGGEAGDLVLNLPPGHPSAHGTLRLRLTLERDRVVGCDPVVGYLHRGAEKLFEVRDYRQIIVLANRHDWLSAFSSELGVVLAVERMLGLEVPLRATWTRTLLAELNRVLSHLAFASPRAEDAFEEREAVRAVMEELSGGRMHYMFNRIGGLKEDLPAGWLDRVAGVVRLMRDRLPELEERVLDNEEFRERTTGVGVLDPAVVDAYGVSGPAARASGVDLDLRRDDPYLAYGDLLRAGLLQVPAGLEGDSYTRFRLLFDELRASLTLADACVEALRALPVGPVNVRLPKVVRPPEGSTYVWTENPLGINAYYLVSRGDRTPWRMKLRTASFNNVAALPAVIEGCLVKDLVTILASMFFVVGDVDK